MKKALTLQLNRTPTGEEVKDGGPALVSEVINALKRKGYAVDSVSGNTMKGVKQYSTGSAFEQRILKARDFAAQIKSDLYEPYDLILMFHPSTAFAFEKENMPPIDKAVMFPTLLGKEYSYFNPGVADEYIEMERRMFSFGHYVQSPSHAQAQILTDVYDVAEERILVRPRGFSPKLFPPQVRTLRSDVSPEKPLTIFCANAVRPQKGHLHFVELARECAKNNIPIRIRLFGHSGTQKIKACEDYKEHFDAEVEEFKDVFDMHEPIDQKLLGKEMDTADMSIIPSIYESFGKSALESSASGLPTIIFDDVPAYKEFLNEESAVFAERAPSGLYAAVEKLLQDPRYYQSLSEKGIENGKQFYVEEMYDQTLSDIESALGLS